MKTLEEIKKEFYKKFVLDVKIVDATTEEKFEVRKAVDVTIKPEEYLSFIESTISQTKQELIEEIKKEINYYHAAGGDTGKEILALQNLLEKESNKK